MDASWQAPPLSLWASSQGKWGGEDEEDARGGRGATIARPTNRVPATERRHGAVACARNADPCWPLMHGTFAYTRMALPQMWTAAHFRGWNGALGILPAAHVWLPVGHSLSVFPAVAANVGAPGLVPESGSLL